MPRRWKPPSWTRPRSPAPISRARSKAWCSRTTPEDGKKFKAYVDHVAKDRSGGNAHWKAFYQTARKLKLV